MKKTLSVRFDRSISSSTNKPDTLEIVLTPLNGANAPDQDATFLAEKQVKRVRLANAVNIVTFDLIPSYMPGLDRPILYRIAWRLNVMGRITQTDFAMPDRDVDFDDLADLGNVIDGENYLTVQDLGVPGRAAQLNNAGQVIDSEGNVVGHGGLDGVTELVAQEVRDRKSADANLDRLLTLRLETQINSVNNTFTTLLNRESGDRATAIASEAVTRAGQDAILSAALSSQETQTNGRFATLTAQVNGHTSQLGLKADLVGGKLPTSQLPAIAIVDVIAVPDEAAMLALTASQVQRGDVAVRPDGTWMLQGTPISSLGSWVQVSFPGGSITSVNGQVGVIVLNAEDVGARSADVAINMNEVNGLNSALTARATVVSLNALQTLHNALDTKTTGINTRLTTLEGVAVKVNGSGEIATTVLAGDVPRVNSENKLVKKDGTVIPTGNGGIYLDEDGTPYFDVDGTGTPGGGGGGGAVASVNGKIGVVVLNAADVGARAAGAVPLADVTGLTAALNARATNTDLTALATRVSRAEVDIIDLKANGGGGGTGGSSKTTVSWVAEAGTATNLVSMKSPFGINNGVPYYDPEGAAEGEAAFPYVTSTGGLVLRQLNSNAPAEPVMATKASVDALAVRVTTLESSGAAKPVGGWLKTDLESAVQATLTLTEQATPSSTGESIVRRNLAGTFAVSEPTATSNPATKKYTDDGLALKATTASVTALTTTVGGKAAQSDLTALAGRTSNIESAMPLKADLDGSNLLLVGQLPNVPIAKVTGANLKADLDGVGGKVPLAQIPTGIPQASVSGLTATLATKADLVGGKLVTSQIPALSTMDPQVVDNRAALLALTSAQVQRGDIGIIRATSDKGTYILMTSDPSVWANWQVFEAASGSVTSVNGQSGTVVLGAADVGARPLGGTIAQADVTGLTADLVAKAATTYVDAQVATRTTPAAVTTQIAAQAQSKLSVDYVATAAVASLSGSQSIDGVLVGAGKRVLLPLQAASSQNGIYLTATGAWTRVADFADGATFIPGSLVVVKTGTVNADSLWQLTTTSSGVVGTNAQNWSKIMNGGVPKTYTAGNGVDVTGTVITAKAGAGIIVDGTGIRLDKTTVVQKFADFVPSGSAVATINHNLGTRDVTVTVYDNASGDVVLVGWTITGVNQVSIEFASAPAVQQWRVVVTG